MRTIWFLAIAAGAAGAYEAVFGIVAATDAEWGIAVFVWVFAAVFIVAGWFVATSTPLWALYAVGIGFLVELVLMPVNERETASDWFQQMTFSAVALVGLVLAVVLVRQARRARISPTG